MGTMKHAPRGRIKAPDTSEPTSEPMPALDPLRCKARSRNRHQGQCKRRPIPGGTVCRYHGGASPQVQRKAMERLMAYQDRAIDRLFGLVEQEDYPSTAYSAVRDVLDRTMGRPSERVELTGAEGGPVEIVTRLAAARKRLASA